ncbi:MAG: glycosyltransferase family 1 protein [Chloroflexota bacterium]
MDYTPAYEQGGGIGRYVRELVAALARQDTDDVYHLFVAGSSSLSSPSFDSNFVWKPTRLSPRWLARIWHRAHIHVPVELFVGAVDLYHATDFVLPPTLPHTKTLLTVHDLSYVRVPETASPNLKFYLDRVVPDSVNRADFVVADSQSTKEDLIDLYGVMESKIDVLLSGVDSRFKRQNDRSVLMTTRTRYMIGTSPYIFSVGTVQPRKNYGRLIQSLALLRASGYDLDLVIAGGRGWLEDPIYETVNTAGMQEHVHFIGFTDDADLPTLYSGAYCCVLPSLYEGFGLPVLESMACGTPVITSNVSSLPEVAGDAAITVDPYNLDAITDAIKQLLDDSTLYQSYVQKGYERAKQFTWDNSARQLRQIYAKLLA